MDDSSFEEGESYELSELPESDMTPSGNLEDLGNGKLAGKFGDTYVTFEYGTVVCTDVTPVDDLD